MKTSRTLLVLSAGLAATSGIVGFATSFITFHPDVVASAKRFMLGCFATWIIASAATLSIALLAVPLAEPHELAEATALRRRGLWLTVPHICAVIFIIIAFLAWCRDFKTLGGL
jgi:hypothetical protein